MSDAMQHLHKAERAESLDPDENVCVHCAEPIHKVPGGDGPVWVHEDGYVVARNTDALEQPVALIAKLNVMLNYASTHRSRLDGSEAMMIREAGDRIILVNEDADEWEDAASLWEALSDA